VAIRRDARQLNVLVEDDGVGGADVSSGSGLRGLQDRVAALDGTLSLTSPRDGGTRLWVTMPVEATAGPARPAPEPRVGSQTR
jgi:signal transduction histidine kinase